MNHRLFNGDCAVVMDEIGPVKCIFADPPDNIGLNYDEYKDKLTDEHYRMLLINWVNTFVSYADIVWISFNARWTAHMGAIVNSILNSYKGEVEFKPCVQVFTFGQHNKNDLGNNHRPLWRLMKKDAKLYPDAIKVPSWRQRNGDKRAAAGGRVPGDVFDMHYPSYDAIRIGSWLSAALDDPGVCDDMKSDIQEWFKTHPGDVFDFPRVTGNSKQRCDWHPTQLHEELVERCIKLSTQEGDTVLDPFGGTGTTLRVCKRLNRPCTLIEMDPGYCSRIASDHDMTKHDNHWSLAC